MTKHEINFSLDFYCKGHPLSNFPDEDKLWFTTWLDFRAERDDTGRCPHGWWLETVDAQCFELPIEFMAYSEEKRESMREELLNRAAKDAAELLDHYGIDDYAVHADVDLMRVERKH